MFPKAFHVEAIALIQKNGYVEILRFRHFVKHVVFSGNGEKYRNKELKKYINISVVVELVCGNTKE